MVMGSKIMVCVCLPFKQHEEDVLLGAKVLYRGCSSANLTPQDVVEDLSYVFFTLMLTGIHNKYNTITICNK